MALGRQAIRVSVTLAVAAIAAVIGWKLWNVYMYEPWTRDARVRATILNLAPDVSGLISSLNVVDNQSVKKGDVLFVIERDRFQAALAQAQAPGREQAREPELANDNARRDQALARADSSAITQVEIETSQATAAVAAAELGQAEAALTTANINLQRTEVRSPVNGFVTNLTASVGDYATTGTPVLAIIDSDSFYVYAYFMETKLPAVRDGDRRTGAAHGRRRGPRGAGPGGEPRHCRSRRRQRSGCWPTSTPISPGCASPNACRSASLLDKIPPDVRLIAGLTATVTMMPSGGQSGK